jgi:hypothetical protein
MGDSILCVQKGQPACSCCLDAPELQTVCCLLHHTGLMLQTRCCLLQLRCLSLSVSIELEPLFIITSRITCPKSIEIISPISLRNYSLVPWELLSIVTIRGNISHYRYFRNFQYWNGNLFLLGTEIHFF